MALAVALAVAAPAAAHKPSRVTAREFVRLAGSFEAAAQAKATAAPADGAARVVTLTVQGRERRFATADWQVFALVSEEEDAAPPAEPERLTLQGPRDLLGRIAGARPEQRVSILAERRPGSGELFVLAADLCPSD